MKKIYFLSILFFLSVTFIKAQTTLTTAVDFTVTDTHGNPHNLFSILNSGKYVCIDFFFTTCVPCQQASPHFKSAFTNFGCNTQDMYFISIDNGDNNALVDGYETNFLGGNSGFPAVSGTQGGGNAVVTSYGIGAFPTFILIAPNKSIVEQDMWPISSPADFDTFFASHSLAHKTCLSGITEETLANSISIFPNPAIENLIIETSNSEKINAIKVYDVLGKLLIDQKIDASERMELNVSQLDKGIYYMEITTQTGKAIKKFNKQ